jgi:Bacteriophage Lambda NinG protein
MRKLKSVPKLLKDAQQVFNRYIRQRDSEDGWFQCISCGFGYYTDLMDAGHYVPQKGGSYLRFHEWNVNGECKRCNGFDEFHLIGYRKNLINKIGEENVKWLEDNRHTVKKWSRSELEEIIKKYSI